MSEILTHFLLEHPNPAIPNRIIALSEICEIRRWAFLSEGSYKILVILRNCDDIEMDYEDEAKRDALHDFLLDAVTQYERARLKACQCRDGAA